MPFPLIPAALSVIGGLAPSIISSIAGAKSEDEARMAIKPKMDAMRAQLIGRGVPSAQVDEQVSEAFKGIIQDEMQKGALPGWAEMLLGVAGGGAGFAAGKMLAKGAGKAAKSAAQQAESGAAAITKTPEAPAAPAVVDDVDLGQAEKAFQQRSLVKPFRPMEMEPTKTPGMRERSFDDGMDAIPAPAPRGGEAALSYVPEELPSDLLLPFGKMASQIEADDLAAVRRRMSRY